MFMVRLFIEKTVHQRIRERLVLETYPLDKTIEIARQYKSGMKEAKLLSESKVESQHYMERIKVPKTLVYNVLELTKPFYSMGNA